MMLCNHGRLWRDYGILLCDHGMMLCDHGMMLCDQYGRDNMLYDHDAEFCDVRVMLLCDHGMLYNQECCFPGILYDRGYCCFVTSHGIPLCATTQSNRHTKQPAYPFRNRSPVLRTNYFELVSVKLPPHRECGYKRV